MIGLMRQYFDYILRMIHIRFMRYSGHFSFKSLLLFLCFSVNFFTLHLYFLYFFCVISASNMRICHYFLFLKLQFLGFSH